MNGVTKAAVQGAACGLMVGAVLLVGGRVWRPATVVAQAKQAAVADVVRARRFEVVDPAGSVRARLDSSAGVTALALYGTGERVAASLSFSPLGASLNFTSVRLKVEQNQLVAGIA
jgi:hypothetical protein